MATREYILNCFNKLLKRFTNSHVELMKQVAPEDVARYHELIDIINGLVIGAFTHGRITVTPAVEDRWERFLAAMHSIVGTFCDGEDKNFLKYVKPIVDLAVEVSYFGQPEDKTFAALARATLAALQKVKNGRQIFEQRLLELTTVKPTA